MALAAVVGETLPARMDMDTVCQLRAQRPAEPNVVGPFRDIGELELLAVVPLLGVLVKVPGHKILHDGHVLVPEDDGERDEEDDELGHVVETAERPVAE